MSAPQVETRLDHLVVGALDLEDGVRWVKERLGVSPPPGGAHPMMATHNHVMSLGGGVYLEVIAPDWNAPDPGRPRWFGLDDPAMRERLALSPALITWVARTNDIAAAAAASPYPLGDVTPMSRGDLNWRVTIPADGALAAGGAMPSLIQWGEGAPHPTTRMPDLRCNLLNFTIASQDAEQLKAAYGAIGLIEGNVVVEKTAFQQDLRAAIASLNGAVTLP